MKWDKTAYAWVGYIDAVEAATQRAIDKGLRIDTSALAHGRCVSVFPIKEKDLRSYQTEGAKFLCSNSSEGALLADDVGLGKTAQALRAARAIGAPTVVVCPSFVRSVWETEVKLWWPEAGEPRMLTGTKSEPLTEYPFTIIHYDVLWAWEKELQGIVKTIIFDEAHYLASEKARRSIAAKTLARTCKFRMGLTATPMTNRIRHLWNVFDTLSEGRFGNFFQFGITYCDGKKEEVTKDRVAWKFDGKSNLEELKKRTSYFMLRRTKTDVALELPDRTRQVLDVEVPKKCQVALDLALRNDQALRKSLDLAADGKIPEVVEMVAEHVKAGHSVIVFSHRKVIAETLATQLNELGCPAITAHGDHVYEERKKRVELAKGRETGALCVTIDAMTTGVSLAFADVAVYAELSWEPHKLVQTEGRLHRHGQKRNVLIQYVVAKGTADEIIRDTLIRKMDTFVEGVGSLDDGLRENLSERSGSAADTLRGLYERMLQEAS